MSFEGAFSLYWSVPDELTNGLMDNIFYMFWKGEPPGYDFPVLDTLREGEKRVDEYEN